MPAADPDPRLNGDPPPDHGLPGDAAGWGELVTQASPRLLRFARAFTRDPHEAEDLVQEAFARAVRSQGTYRGDAAPTTWLARILRNVAIDRARRPRREVLVDEIEERWRDDRYTVDPEAVLARAESRDELLDALSRLSHAYRSVVVLHDVEGWTVREIAEALEIDLPAAKQRLRRGRMALVSVLATEAERRVALKGVPMRCWEARRHVSDFLDGTLDDETVRTVERHLRTCPTCPPLVAALTGTTRTLGALRDPDQVIDPALLARLRLEVSRVRG